MQTISIPRSVFNHKQPFLFHNGLVDILGSILISKGYELPDKIRLPSQLKIEIPHFTRIIRRQVIDSGLTIQLLMLDSHPQGIAIEMANRLLQGNYHLEIIEK